MATKNQPAPKPDDTPADAAAETAAAAAPTEPGAVDATEEPAATTGETVWFETGTGQHEVEVGSQAYENLVQQGATQIDAPTETEEAKE